MIEVLARITTRLSKSIIQRDPTGSRDKRANAIKNRLTPTVLVVTAIDKLA